MTARQSRGPHVFRIVPLAVALFALVACDQGNGRTADGDLKVMVTVSEELASSVGGATEAYEEAIEEAVRVMEANLAKTSHAGRACGDKHGVESLGVTVSPSFDFRPRSRRPSSDTL